MKKTFPGWILYVAAFLLYVLHNDLWFWNDPRFVLGLPIGLLYHVAFCLAASVLMVFLVIYAWPEKLEVEEEREEE
ncbi:MAG: DUF3311 domain-containing protein [Acidobacteriota bacterium]